MALKKAAIKEVATRNITAAVAKRIKNVNTHDWVYVSPKDNMWSVRKEGATRAIRVYKQRVTAVNAAKRIASDLLPDSQVIVYNLQGEISKIIK